MPIGLKPTGTGIPLPEEQSLDITQADCDEIIDEFATTVTLRTPTTTTDADYGSPQSGSNSDINISCVWHPVSLEEVNQEPAGIAQSGDVWAFCKGGQTVNDTDFVIKDSEEYMIEGVKTWQMLGETIFKRLHLRRVNSG